MGNPQGAAVLFSEVVSARIAELLGVPVARHSFISFDPSIAQDVHFETTEGVRAFGPGPHFGSRVVLSTPEGRTYDTLPENCRPVLRDDRELTGGALLHLWLRNTDTPQPLFWRHSCEEKFAVTFIDHGHCLGGPSWRITPEIDRRELAEFPIEHLRYWLARLRQISSEELATVLDEIPEEWNCNEKARRLGLLQCIQSRRWNLISDLRGIIHPMASGPWHCQVRRA
jgi:hypothetical protein